MIIVSDYKRHRLEIEAAAAAGGSGHRVIRPEELDARARLLRAAVGFALGHTPNVASINGEAGACSGGARVPWSFIR